MAELLTLARPYAKAAFAYASEQNATDSWSSALNLLSAAVQDEAFSAFLTRPELTPAEQVSLFAKVLGEDQTVAVSNFLTLLAENNRLALLPEISAEYEQLKSQNNNTVDVVIESAFPLTSVQEQLLAHALEKKFEAAVNVSVEVWRAGGRLGAVAAGCMGRAASAHRPVAARRDRGMGPGRRFS